MCTPEERKDIVARIEKMLKQKRYCFWYVRVDSQKQQLVLNAEKCWNLYVKHSIDSHWVHNIKNFNNKCIMPLLGAPESKYYKHYHQLSTEIQSLK